MKGLSPRVRGNLLVPCCWAPSGRSIPACAGEPVVSRDAEDLRGVYPRVCGGTRLAPPETSRGAGLSPRVRGNQRLSGGLGRPAWSIPACAGEPLAGKSRWSGASVYPRVCGGTDCGNLAIHKHMGLSPRVRGNLQAVDANVSGPRSIPACAGEPTAPRPAAASRKVYPRVCGGTRDLAAL